MELLFATSNAHKVEEVRSVLPAGVTVKSLADIGFTTELPETTGTIAGNSFQKAQTLYEATDMPCFAEDTGLEINALDGRPGVYSARYAGLHASYSDNVAKVLTEMTGIIDRRARFVTIITQYTAAGYQQWEGICEGEILDSPRGAGGFGYDSIFLPKGCNQSFGEMRLIDKNAVSHRQIAMTRYLAYLTANQTNPSI
jgi:XTP/dITP diphosphohydrolase